MTFSLLRIAALASAVTLGGAAYAESDCQGNCEPPGESTKGNNGWGNGPDTTNPGSFSGRTADSKSTNGYGFRDKFEGR